jgi:hypothetical protein
LVLGDSFAIGQMPVFFIPQELGKLLTGKIALNILGLQEAQELS